MAAENRAVARAQHIFASKWLQRRTNLLGTLVPKEKHRGKKENEENGCKETSWKASFISDYFIEDQLSAGSMLYLSTPDEIRSMRYPDFGRIGVAVICFPSAYSGPLPILFVVGRL